MKKVIRLSMLIFTMLLSLLIVSCGNRTEYTLNANGTIPDISKGYFGEQNSTVFMDLSEFFQTNADDILTNASTSNPNVVSVDCNKEKLTLSILAEQGNSDIIVNVSSEKANKNLEFNFKVTSEKYNKVACIGDSLTYGHTWQNEAYPVYLSEILGSDIEVKNFGKNGASVTGYNPPLNLKYSEQPEFTESLDYDADIVILMLGTNDSKGWSDAENIFKEDYEKLIKSYYTKNPNVKIILVTAPPTMENNKFSIPGDVITENIVPLQKEIAEENALSLTDFSGHFLDFNDPYTKFIRGDASFDGVHLTKEGAKFLAELIAEKIFEF